MRQQLLLLLSLLQLQQELQLQAACLQR